MIMIHKLFFLIIILFLFSDTPKTRQTISMTVDKELWKLRFVTPLHKKIDCSKKLYAVCVQHNYQIGKGMCLIRLSECLSRMNQYDEALKLLYKSEDIAIRMNNDSLLLYSEFGKAVQYGRLRQTGSAVALIEKCFSRANCIRSADARHLFRSQLYAYKAFFLAGVYSSPHYRKLLRLHLNSMKEYEKIRYKTESNYTYNNVGYYYSLMKKNDSAEYFLNKILKNKHCRNNHDIISTAQLNMAELYMADNRIDQAKKYLDSARIMSGPDGLFSFICIIRPLWKNVWQAQG